MKIKFTPAVFFWLLASMATDASAQTGNEIPPPGPVVPFDAVHWKTKGIVEADIFAGRSCIKITNGELDLVDAGFKNGTIDFDMAVDRARYFPGMGFRMQDTANGELYYLRPHQSGNQDAMQYFPMYHGSDSWQLYYGPGFNNARNIPLQQWIHFHFVIKDSAAEIFWDGEKSPAIYISRLERKPVAGYILLNNGGPNPAWFSNFTYNKTDAVSIQSPAPATVVLPPDRITHWDVSDPFDEALLDDKTSLGKAPAAGLHWHSIESDERGITDFARLAPHKTGSNTVFARMIVHGAQAGIRKFKFGFSDRVRVYLNGNLLYAGADVFRSRDYRFLGTIGLFDALYLPIHKGDNELLIAVSEDFGGWGLEAELN